MPHATTLLRSVGYKDTIALNANRYAAKATCNGVPLAGVGPGLGATGLASVLWTPCNLPAVNHAPSSSCGQAPKPRARDAAPCWRMCSQPPRHHATTPLEDKPILAECDISSPMSGPLREQLQNGSKTTRHTLRVTNFTVALMGGGDLTSST